MKTDFIKENRKLGAWVEPSGGAHFRLWAPKAEKVELALFSADGKKEIIPMEKGPQGYFGLQVKNAKAGDRYKFLLDGKNEFPDPASRYQPEGPHGPSQIVESQFAWTDQNWKGVPRDQLTIYELHVGTFSSEGTFEGIAKRLEHFKNLGINAIEIMPVAQYSGNRNWGYDGVGLFATQNSYGGNDIAPLALKRLVNQCHEQGIAVILDVVYNHLGPEGNYLSQFGPYFQSKYKTPWGEALNYDGDFSDEVRRYFLENARQWLEEFHFDGLRLDAVHAIFDTSARPFLEELHLMKESLIEKTGRPLYLIAESDANDPRILYPPEEGGLGMDAQWADDLHHTIHSLVTGETHGYYSDYGKLEHLAIAFQDGVVFHGGYSEFRHRSHGRSYQGIERSRLVVCSQNHDQIGNRLQGDRLIALVGPEKAKLAAACCFLSPGMPLMFMGEELAEDAPFMYFVSHSDPQLIEAVRKGRKEEFASFQWKEEAPDPASPDTFEKSKLRWERLQTEPLTKDFINYYKRLISLSKWIRREKLLEAGCVKTQILSEGRILQITGKRDQKQIHIYFSFSSEVENVSLDSQSQQFEILLNSSENEILLTEKSKNSLSGKGPLRLAPYSAFVMGTDLV